MKRAEVTEVDTDVPDRKRQYVNDIIAEMQAKITESANDANNSNLVEEVIVPRDAVGMIIGRAGENIKRLTHCSGARVQFKLDEDPTQPDRVAVLQGTLAAINEAKLEIQKCVIKSAVLFTFHVPEFSQENAARLLAIENGAKLLPPSTSHSATITVPARKAGLLIGKGGETIKAINAESGAYVQLATHQDNPTVEKVFNITGCDKVVANAKWLIEQKLQLSDRQPQNIEQAVFTYGGDKTGEIVVPRSAVGMIIGKSGENIQRMSYDSKCRIQFRPDDDPRKLERVCVLSGAYQSVQMATKMIADCVRRAEIIAASASQCQPYHLHVPMKKAHLVTGVNGDGLRQIHLQSGADVRMDHAHAENTNDQVFIITGDRFQIHAALHLIRIRVGDIADGTPIPPLPNSNNYVAYDSTAPSWGQNQRPMHYSDATSSYNKPFGQTAQVTQACDAVRQYQQREWSATTTPTMTTTTAPTVNEETMPRPSINPATGQSDFSEHWIEYYKFMGMHEQARQIEDLRNPVAVKEKTMELSKASGDDPTM